MAIETVTSKIQSTLISDQGVDLELSNLQQQKTTAPILAGASVKVTSGVMSDLEALVAKLRNENETTRQDVSQRRLSILSTVLDSMADRISAAEKKNLLQIEELNGQKSAAKTELAGLQCDKTAAEGRIATLDLEIKALEDQIKQAVADGADHREKVAKLKAQRADEQAKLDQINGAIQSVTAKIAGLDVQIAECTAAIGSKTLSEVSSALRAATGEENFIAERPETQAARDKKAEKEAATDIANQISESLDKIDKQILDALAEAQELVKA